MPKMRKWRKNKIFRQKHSKPLTVDSLFKGQRWKFMVYACKRASSILHQLPSAASQLSTFKKKQKKAYNYVASKSNRQKHSKPLTVDSLFKGQPL